MSLGIALATYAIMVTVAGVRAWPWLLAVYAVASLVGLLLLIRNGWVRTHAIRMVQRVINPTA